MRKHIIVEIVCLLFVILFVYAAVNKLLDVEKFRVQIGQSPMLSLFAHWLAVVIPMIEIIISIMLVFSTVRLFALYAALALMVVFTSYIVAILNFSIYIPCSCGGVLEKLGWTEHLIFNCLFVLMAVVAITIETRLTTSPQETKSISTEL
jgi:hypothetical protein